MSHGVIAQPHGMKISAYDIDVNADLSARQFLINARLSIEMNGLPGNVTLLLSRFASIKDLQWADHEIIPFHFTRQDTLSIRLPEKSDSRKKLTLYFSYILPADSFLVNRGMMMMKRVDRWYPLQIGDLFTSELRVTVPDNYITLSNGSCRKKSEVDHRRTFVWGTTHESDLALFIFNPDSMEYKSEVVEGAKINFYFVPGLKNDEKIISQVKSSFSFFSDYLGKYRNENYTVIEIPADWFLGQSLNTLLLFSSKLPDYIPDPGAWVPHEVGHQWFGNTVVADEKELGWWFVEESINEYLRAIYVEHEYGSDSLKHMMKNFYLANYNATVKNGKDISIMDVLSVNNSLEEAQSIYAKGPIILHQLRRCMGEANWNSFIKNLYHDFKNRLLTLDDFKIYISKYDHEGQCLKLFNNLLITKGIPENISFE
jgi:aminopeptidase N